MRRALLLLTLTACTKPCAEPAAPAPSGPDPRSPADFVAEWAAVQMSPPEERDARGLALEKSWEGRRYTWDGYALAALCLEAERSCAINTFPADIPNRGTLGGMFPKVAFDEPGWAKLKADCKGQVACVVRFSAPLSDLVAAASEPLALRFGPAELLEVRQPREDEPWFRKTAPAERTLKSDLSAVRADESARTQLPFEIRPQTF